MPGNTQVVVILDEQGIIENPKYYFKHSHQLKTVHIPEDIHTIKEFPFQNCTNLKSIVLPKDSIL